MQTIHNIVPYKVYFERTDGVHIRVLHEMVPKLPEKRVKKQKYLIPFEGLVRLSYTFNEIETLPYLALWLVVSLEKANQGAVRGNVSVSYT